MATVDLLTHVKLAERHHNMVIALSRFATWYDSQSNEKITMPMESLFEIFLAIYPKDIPTVAVKNKVTTVTFKWEGKVYIIRHDLLLGDRVRCGKKYATISYPFNMNDVVTSLA